MHVSIGVCKENLGDADCDARRFLELANRGTVLANQKADKLIRNLHPRDRQVEIGMELPWERAEKQHKVAEGSHAPDFFRCGSCFVFSYTLSLDTSSLVLHLTLICRCKLQSLASF